jgi:chromosome partitioning protein
MKSPDRRHWPAALIPVQPSPYDVWAAKEIVDLVQEAIAFKENLKGVFVISRKIVNTAIGRYSFSQ